MNTNLRALAFGAAVAVVLMITLNVVFASSTPAPIRLETVQVVAHAHATDGASVTVGCVDSGAAKARKTA
jgi:hypothetical protein